VLAPALTVTVEVGVVHDELLQNSAPAPPPDKFAVMAVVTLEVGTRTFNSSNTRTVVPIHLLAVATWVDVETASPTAVLLVPKFVGPPDETLMVAVAFGVHPTTEAVRVILAPGTAAVVVGFEK
jgi:hypothetical protein